MAAALYFRGEGDSLYPFSPDGKLKWIGDSARYFPFCIRKASFQHRRLANGMPQPAGGAF